MDNFGNVRIKHIEDEHGAQKGAMGMKMQKNYNKIADEVKRKYKEYHKNNSPKENKKDKQKHEKISSFTLLDLIKNLIGAIIGFILGIILFIPRQIKKLLNKVDKFDLFNAICIGSVVIGIIIMIMGLVGVLQPTLDLYTDFINETVPSLFGFRLTKAYTDFVTSIDSIFIKIILYLLYIIVAPFNLLLNIGVLILVIINYIIYIIFGILFTYGLGAVLVILPLLSMIKSKNKAVPTLILVVNIILTIIYYLLFTTFYTV